MTKAKSYLFGSLTIGLVASALQAAPIASFTFETVPPTTASGVLADQGTGTASVTTGGAISNPAGNAIDTTPSIESYSSNGWDVGEYYQFNVSTAGFEDITVGFDATGSNTGPRDFTFAYSTDGTTFTTVGTYTLTNDAWNTSTDVAASAKFFDLSAVTAVDDAAGFTVRMIDASTTSISGVTVATTGTSRIDNVFFSGTPLVAVPEPATLAALAGMGLVAFRRRRA